MRLKGSAVGSDFAAATGQKPTYRRTLKFFMLNPGFRAVIIFRIQNFLSSKGFIRSSYLVFQLNSLLHGCEFIPGCVVGRNFVVRHPFGIVVGQGAEIGSGCFLQHGVTLGVSKIGSHPSNSYPRLGDNVEVGTYAVILGGIQIGSGVTVGAFSLVNKDVPDRVVVAGIPAKIISYK